MELTTEQQRTIDRGEAVQVRINGKPYVLLSREAYEKFNNETDYGTMTIQEMNLLADETHEIISQTETDEY